MKFWFQKHTITGRVPALDKMYQEHFNQLLDKNDVVHIESLPEQTYQATLPEGLVRFAGAEAILQTHFMKMAVTAEQQGFDAFIIGTSQDPALRECRALTDIPVIGYGESAALYALANDFKVGIVGFIPELFEAIAENYHRMGLDRILIGSEKIIGGPEIMAAAFAGATDSHFQAFQIAAKSLIDQGATLLIPGEGLTNELLVSQNITEIDGVPILDPVAIAIEFARMMHNLQTAGAPRKSNSGYWNKSLDKSAREQLIKGFLSS